MTNDNCSITATFPLLHNVPYQYSRLPCFAKFLHLKFVRYHRSTLYNYSKNKSDLSVKGGIVKRSKSMQNYIHISICTFFLGINLTNDNGSTTATFLLLHNVRYQYSRLHCFGNFWPLKFVRYHSSIFYNHSKNKL